MRIHYNLDVLKTRLSRRPNYINYIDRDRHSQAGQNYEILENLVVLQEM